MTKDDEKLLATFFSFPQWKLQRTPNKYIATISPGLVAVDAKSAKEAMRKAIALWEKRMEAD